MLDDAWRSFWANSGKRSAPGIDGVSPQLFHEQKPQRIATIRHNLLRGYEFERLRGIAVPKTDPSKHRLICIPTVADRIVQRVLLWEIERHQDRLGIINDVSFGFVRSLGPAKRGVRAAHQRATKLRQEAPWAFKADIAKFFDTIPRTALKDEFCRSFRQPSLNALIEGAINCEVTPSGRKAQAAIIENGITTGKGLRQGMPLSPTLSNFYLRHFDKAIVKRFDMVRYADDLIIFTASESSCHEAADFVRTALANLGLNISDEKTDVYPPDQSVEFLGMELAKDSASKYKLLVSNAQMSKIRNSFTQYHDISLVAQKQLNIVTLLQRLANMRLGYGAAYGTADNFKMLDHKMGQWSRNCAERLYRSIFGSDAIKNLSKAEKDFLLMDR